VDPIGRARDAAGAVVTRVAYGGRADVPAHVVESGTTRRIASDPLGAL
jgi:hypothetical protein